MTGKETNLSERGSRCRICTGCGRCFGKKKMDTVSVFCGWGEAAAKSAAGSGAESISGERLHDLGREKAWLCREEAAGQKGFLAAVDIGTTTVAMQLRSLRDGSVLDTFTCLNPQGKYGADVLSRIEAAEDAQRKKAMCREIRDALKTGILQFQRTLTGAAMEIFGIVIAANTTMVHLLMDLDVSRMGKAPFLPETLSEIRTSLFGIPALILPGLSAFVGADIFAGIHALSMQKRQEITLLLDLGTNGEMVLGNRERLIATAAAAGPAFEGNADDYGTDLMALAARLLDEGLLDETGMLADPYFEEGIDIGGVRLTQGYIRQLQMAKAAICTGIRILCEKYGISSFQQIDKVFLAGGMGYYLSPEAAARIGLLPAELAGKTVAVGNAALEGAFLYGWQRLRRAEADFTADERQPRAEFVSLADGQFFQAGGASAADVLPPRTEAFNLAEEPQFAERYLQEINFPLQGGR